jgi:hypothetical protein
VVGTGERGLAVVDVRDDGHVADVVLAVHDLSHLVGGKVGLCAHKETVNDEHADTV